MADVYDTIGKGYARTRSADSSVVERMLKLLDLSPHSSVLDVGAGTGNYSHALAKAGHEVTALEPSKVMRDQAEPHSGVSWVEGHAEELPFEANSFDGVVMTLSMHHFVDWENALREANRVVRNGPIVIFTFDPDHYPRFWLFKYFPSLVGQAKACFPIVSLVENFVSEQLGCQVQVHRFPLPPDIRDHFAAAGWARPELYLEETYRAGISHFASGDQEEIKKGVARLSRDLESGRWDRKFGHLRKFAELDVGFLFITMSEGARLNFTK